jgi:hypothetical protein
MVHCSTERAWHHSSNRVCRAACGQLQKQIRVEMQLMKTEGDMKEPCLLALYVLHDNCRLLWVQGTTACRDVEINPEVHCIRSHCGHHRLQRSHTWLPPAFRAAIMLSRSLDPSPSQASQPSMSELLSIPEVTVEAEVGATCMHAQPHRPHTSGRQGWFRVSWSQATSGGSHPSLMH